MEMKVAERTRALEEVNDELNSFAYSVSHDLESAVEGAGGIHLRLVGGLRLQA